MPLGWGVSYHSPVNHPSSRFIQMRTHPTLRSVKNNSLLQSREEARLENIKFWADDAKYWAKYWAEEEARAKKHIEDMDAYNSTPKETLPNDGCLVFALLFIIFLFFLGV